MRGDVDWEETDTDEDLMCGADDVVAVALYVTVY